MSAMGKRLAVGGGLLAVLLALGATPAAACDAPDQTAFGVSPGCFDVQFSGAPTAGDPAPAFLQAGGHPDRLEFGFRVNAPAAADPVLGANSPPEPLKDLYLEFPPGFVARPGVVATCPLDLLREAPLLEVAPRCPPASQVGTARIALSLFGGEPGFLSGLPLYSLKPPPGTAARFGLNLLGLVTSFDARLTQGPEPHLQIELRDLNQGLSVLGLDLTLWGTPADPAHDTERSCPGSQIPALGGPGCSAAAATRAFMRMPTSCAGPTATSLRVDSWAHPGAFQATTSASHLPPSLFGDPAEPASYPAPYPGLDAGEWGSPSGLGGCELTGFGPSLSVRPTTSAAAEPAGLEVQMRQPQGDLEDPDAIAPSDLRAATIELPPQLTVNASLANGLGACPSSAVGIGSDHPARCPAASTLGTVEARIPLLEEPLRGSIYFGSSEATPTGLLLSVYLVAANEAATVKVPATIEVDRLTGQVTARLRDLPQVPIAELSLRFFGGQRAPFVTPGACGRYAALGRFASWAGAVESGAGDGFSVDSGGNGGACPAGVLPFSPRLLAGVDYAIAGASSSLRLELSRDDRQQPLASFLVSLPEGLSASPADVGRCSNSSLAELAGHELDGRAEIAAPSCPASSKVGEAVVSVGSGSRPLELRTGQVYLAGPYGGAPLSLAIVIPAVAGEVDLGTVLVRARLTVDPISGRLSLSGRLPTRQEGVPLNLRRVSLAIDRPGFIRNPTRCRRSAITARVDGVAGSVVRLSTPFQVHDCGALGFGAGLRARLLGGPGSARHAAHPRLRFSVRPRPGGANLSKATILLPAGQQLDPARLHAICGREEFAARSCPANTRYGQVSVASSALGKTLSSPLYLRESKHGFPDLAADLRGEFRLVVAGRIGFSGGRVQIRLIHLPDLPLTRLDLTLAGGRRGLLVNNRDLCRGGAGLTAKLRGTNGKLSIRKPALQVKCDGRDRTRRPRPDSLSRTRRPG